MVESFAIVHNGVIEHFAKNFEYAMIYIKKVFKRRRKMHDQNSIDKMKPLLRNMRER